MSHKTTITCEKCPAACCKWEVWVASDEDHIPEDLLELNEANFPVMKRHPVTRYCVAMDTATMQCKIYDTRPRVCRVFKRGGSGCVDARAQIPDLLMRQYR